MPVPNRKKEYKLEFVEGHGLRTETDYCYFSASSRASALRQVARTLEIKLPLTVKAFHAAGAKVLTRGDKQIFPEPALS